MVSDHPFCARNSADEGPLSQLIQDGWEFFEDLDSEAEVSVTVKTLKKTGALPGIDKYDATAIWAAIEAYRSGGGQDVVGDADIKGPEWDVLTEANPPTDYPHFMSKKVGTPSGFNGHISRVLLLERLREVNALLGFTRSKHLKSLAIRMTPADG